MFRVIAGLVGFFLAASALQAQPRQGPIPGPPRIGRVQIGMDPSKSSHSPLPGEQELDDFRHWLEGKSGKGSQDKIDPELLKKLMENLPKDQKADPKQIEQMLKDNPQFRDPAFLKQLEQMLGDKNFPQNMQDTFPKNDDPANLGKGQDLSEQLKKVIEAGNKQGDPNAIEPKVADANLGGDGNSSTDPKLPSTPDESPYKDNQWVKWLEKNFKDSPAASNAVKDLLGSMEKNKGKGMFDNIPQLKDGGWKDLNNWGKANTGDLWKSKPPDWKGGNFKSPRIGGTSGGGSSWGGGGGSSSGGSSGGGFGGASGAGFEGGSTALIVIAALVGGALIAFLLFRKWKIAQMTQVHALAHGAVPIDFDAIRSREELVRVFDQVSLETCGEDARNWNHRVIADQIAEAQPAHVEPAAEVAELYERARYAPLDEDLTAGELSSAQRDLRTIAGATP